MDLTIKYDAEADILVLKVREGGIANEELLDNDIILGYDSEGKLVSVEIMDASKRGLLNTLFDLKPGRRQQNSYSPK